MADMMLAIEVPAEDSVFEFGFDENVALASPSFSRIAASCLRRKIANSKKWHRCSGFNKLGQ